MKASSQNNAEIEVWRPTPWIWISGIVVAAIIGFTYYSSLQEMVRRWGTSEEFSYGYLIPFITLFLIWQRKDVLERMPFYGSWVGFAIVIGGYLLSLLGELTTLHSLVQYAVIAMVAGLALACVGRKPFASLIMPLFLLVFMVPLPAFFLNELSANLQLISSQLGVAFIRLFGISVFLEGNVIDLGTMKLQVVEACSGLRYLFPLMTIGFIAAYFFKVAFWKRALVFLSTIPITVLMNSLRIGIIGVLVEYGGVAQAQGFLHDFEGWAVFMACTALLVSEMWLLVKMGKERRSLREVFGIEFPAPTPKEATIAYRALPKPFAGAVLFMVISAVITLALPQRAEISPARQDFSQFPLVLGEWQGKSERLESIYLDALKLDDYLLVNYGVRNQAPINLYIAYYASQKKGQSAHSPRTCIPGGGWRIASFTQHRVERGTAGGSPLQVNRLLIQMGNQKQLVYYWFQERNRVITNEYLVKWYIFWDALTRNRTDGALVRLTTVVLLNETMEAADNRLTALLHGVQPLLPAYIPD